MEPNFQTSFIPKRPMIEERVAPSSSSSVSLLVVASIFIFLTVVVGSMGLFFYRGILARNLVQMEADLNAAKARFEPSKIVQLQKLDKRLQASSELLSKHVAISPIFEVLQDITMRSIQYTSFDYTFVGGGSSRIEVTLRGITTGYRSIALQSDIFTDNEFLIDPVFSDLALDEDANVLFNLRFAVDPNLVNYKGMLEARNTPVESVSIEESVNIEESVSVEESVAEEIIDIPN